MFFTLKSCYDDIKDKEIQENYVSYMSVELTILLSAFFFSLGYPWYVSILGPLFLHAIALYIKNENPDEIAEVVSKERNVRLVELLGGRADVHMNLIFWILTFHFLIGSFFYPMDASFLYGFVGIIILLYMQYEVTMASKRKISAHIRETGDMENAHKAGIGFLPFLFASCFAIIVMNYIVFGMILANNVIPK